MPLGIDARTSRVLVLSLAVAACGGRTISRADAGDGGACHSLGSAVVPDGGVCGENLECPSDPYQYLVRCACATSTCTCTRADGKTDTLYNTIPTTHCGCDSSGLVSPEIITACGLQR